jgi:hypothetical protein
LSSLRRVGNLVEARSVAGEIAVQLVERSLCAGIDRDSRDGVEEFVAGCAVDVPARPQRFVCGEDLFHHEIEGRAEQLAARTQQIAVAERIVEPIDVIEAQSVDRSALQQRKRELVRVGKDRGVFHSQPR